MPTWLIHGFRWPRSAIRIHIILHNLDDCAPGWIMAPDTAAELAESFQKLYPERMKHITNLRFIEQYDPDDETVSDQPYAYVCDQVREIKLGVDLDDVKNMSLPSEGRKAIEELRRELAPDMKLGWFVVVNGDVERYAPPLVEEDDETQAGASLHGTEKTQLSSVSRQTMVSRPEDEDGVQKGEKRGFKSWLGRVKKSKSMKDLRSGFTLQSSPDAPPLPSPSQTVTSPNKVNGKMPV